MFFLRLFVLLAVLTRMNLTKKLLINVGKTVEMV